MTSNLGMLVPLLAGAAFLLAACGDDGGAAVTVPAGPTATPTAVPTATAMPTADLTPSPTAAPSPTPEAPNAAPIELDPGVTSLGEDVLLPTLQAGGVLNLDPIDLAGELGITPPPCAALVLYLSWQVRSPYPPEGVDIELYWTRMGGTDLIGEGTSGQTSRGCGAIQVVNNSDVEVTVEIRYAIGEITG
ncbi:MAG: hypothetical protein IIA91_00220 [Chloroflexi bacterium]|nr:hypothetical protein [Chloroflexota bacterium]